jgi:hypothetical protein
MNRTDVGKAGDRKAGSDGKAKPAASKGGMTGALGNIAGSIVAPVPPKDDGSREARIALEAYYRAERRGFAPGQALDDWLEAEKEFEKSKRADH